MGGDGASRARVSPAPASPALAGPVGPVLGRYALGPWARFALAVAFALLLAAGLLALRDQRQAELAGAWVRHTLLVLQQTEAVSAALLRAETGQRGYVLTGDPHYLEPYQRARDEIERDVETLRALTADNAAQQARIGELRPLVETKLAELAETIELRRTSGLEAALRVLGTDLGKATMDRIGVALDAVRSEEDRLLSERVALRQVAQARASSGIVLLTGLSLAAFLVIIVWLARFARARRAAEIAALAAEAASRSAQERLRVTLESIGDGVIAADANGHVAFMNPVAEALTGWRVPDASGLPIDHVFRIVNEFTRETVESPISKVLREGIVAGLANHTLLVARDGSERPIDDSGAPIRGPGGELLGVVLVFRDVSARRSSEQTRERLLRSEAQREAAESASRAKDEFLAVMSHELRAPMTAASIWVGLLAAGTLDDAQRARAIDAIDRNLRSQVRLIDDLLDVSRVVSGKLSIERVPADLSEMVGRVLADFREGFESRRIDLHVSRPGVLIAQVDPDRFAQIVRNLLSNAIKFSSEGGRVEVELRDTGREVVLTVRDWGRGIPAAFLPRVFDRFSQAESVLTRSTEGLGLGLAISKYLIELHGGTIEAESEGEDRGATFRVTLPSVSPAARPRARASGPEEGPLRGRRILVVEDHDDSREALVLVLRRRGAEVLEAASMAAGLEHFVREQPDLVLSDLGMSGESGFELIREIRLHEKPLGIHTPVIATTGFASDSDRRRALEAGFDDLVPKPLDVRALVERIRSTLALYKAPPDATS